MKKKRVLALFMTVLMAGGLLAGCGSSDGGSTEGGSGSDSSGTEEVTEVNLTVWGPQEDQAAVEGYDEGILKAMCEAFDEAHPEWEINFEYGVCGEGEARDVVTKDVEEAGDVYFFANDQIPTLADAGALAKLGGSTADWVKENNAETMVQSVTYKDGIYGVPFTSNTWFMYYDKSKYTEDEVKSLDTMMAKDLGEGVYNFAFPMDNSWYIEAFYFGAGCSIFGDGTDASAGCDFDSEAGIAATQYMVDLAANPKYSNEKDGSSLSLFSEGRLGAYCSGSWDAAAIREALGENFGAVKLPTVTINGTEGQMRSFAGSKAIGVNPNCENPEVAVALAQYLGGQECQQIRYETRGITPTLSGIEVGDDEVAAAEMSEISEASFLQPVLSEMNAYWTPAETMGKEIIQGDVTADNAAEKTQAMVEGILSDGL